MEFQITHITEYHYSHPAAEAYGEARLTPPTRPGQEVLNHQIRLEPAAGTSAYSDYYGNQVDFFSLPFRHDRLKVTNTALVRTLPLPRPTQGLETTVQECRQILHSAMADIFHFTQPTAVVEIGRESVQWAKKLLPSNAPLGKAIHELNGAIYAEFAYQSGSTENSTPLGEIWKSRTGVCQDFAHIGLSILRAAGLPARYVCGYIETHPPDAASAKEAALEGAVATHAWVEVLVPGMRWVAIDPTNRQWADERYVAVSFGRDYRDAAPLRGTFKGSGGQRMSVRVHMKRTQSGPTA